MKTAHEWGYTWTEEATIESLSRRHIAWMQLAEQAEGFIKEQSMPDEHGRSSLSRSQYNADASRREWKQQFS